MTQTHIHAHTDTNTHTRTHAPCSPGKDGAGTGPDTFSSLPPGLSAQGTFGDGTSRATGKAGWNRKSQSLPSREFNSGKREEVAS